MDGHNPLIEALQTAGPKGMAAAGVRKLLGIAKNSPIDLKKLKADGSVRALKLGGKFIYFILEHVPTRERAEDCIEQRLRDSGLTLTTLAVVTAVVKGPLKPFFKDALASLKADGMILEVYGPKKSKMFLHRGPLLEQLRLDHPSSDATDKPPSKSSPLLAPLLRDRVIAMYRDLKAEQGGISAVSIADLLAKLKVHQDELHAFLLDAAANGLATLHPSSALVLTPAARQSAISIPGQSNPLVSVVFKD